MSKFFHPHLSRRKKQIKEKEAIAKTLLLCPATPPFAARESAAVRRHTAVIHSSSFKKIRVAD